ncbi:MAG: hypothetical protein II842_08095 [Butyrivibrio sp.]|nr:hypothetical protein [Butyrivibrio sp.]
MISITEIVLIVAGFAAIIIGYLLPASKEMDEEDKMLMEREIRELVRREVEDQKEFIENMVDDTVDNSLDRTERAMERISNEKLSAIGEYSDTVINDIHKNHDEVMFMYDMLNDKHKNLTDVVSEVSKKTDEAKQAVRDAEVTAREAQEATTNLENAVKKPIPREENVRAILLDEADDKLSGIRIPYKEKEPEITSVNVPVSNPKPETGYVSENELRPLHEIPAQVISAEQASTLHVIGNKPDTANSNSGKVVQLTEAIRAEGRTQNPDKNMKELTATDPISQNRQIIEMHKAGKSNMVIARELGLGIGEVKLVIDLSNKHRKVK